MIKEGNLHLPGEGFIYMLPVTEGIINLRSLYRTTGHAATMTQIIRAIDELKGSNHWRQKLEFEVNQDDKRATKRKYLENLVRLTCIAKRENCDDIVTLAMENGAPGASISYGIDMRSHNVNESDIAINIEKGLIDMTVSESMANTIINAITDKVKVDNLEDVICYTNNVPKAFTYIK